MNKPKIFRGFIFCVMIFRVCNAMQKAELCSLSIFIKFPPHVIDRIFDNLDCKTLCKISLVCKVFNEHAKEINKRRQLGVVENGTLVLRDQDITLPLSDNVFFNQELPLAIEGTVTFRCAGDQRSSFSFREHCVIKSGAKLHIDNEVILEIAPRDNSLEPLKIEDETGWLILSNATLKTKTNNPDGVFFNFKNIIFVGNCVIDAKDGILNVIAGMHMYPEASIVCSGELIMINE